MKNLVIVVQVFPPSTAIGARRFGEIAPYLEEFGYKPWIITMHSPGTPCSRIPKNQIIEIGNFSRGELDKARWAADRPLIRKIERWGFRPIYLDPAMWTWARKVWRVRRQLKERIGQVDCIMGSFGPPAAMWIAKELAHEWHVPWIADFRDLGALRQNSRKYLIRRIDQMIEHKWLNSASAITTVGPTFAELCNAEYKKPLCVVYNGFDEVKTVPTTNKVLLDNRIQPPFIHYAGQIYPNQVTSFKLTLRALTQMPNLQLVFRILGPRHLELELEKYARELNLTNRVLFLPPQERGVVTAEARESAVNLVVAQMYEPSRGTLPAKFFGLLPLRPPILGVGPEDSDIGNLMRQTKKGALCHNEKDIVSFVEAAIKSPDQFKGNEIEIQKYSKRMQTNRLAEFLNQVVG